MREINGDMLVMEILRPRNRENDLANYRFYNEGNRRMLEKSIKGAAAKKHALIYACA